VSITDAPCQSATPAPSAPSDGQTPAGEGSQTPAPAPTPAPEEKKPPPPKGKDNPQPPPPPTILHRALHSPKVLIECPIAVVLIFQTYKAVVQPALLEFYPLVMDSIKLQPEPQRIAYEEAKAKGEIFVGVASGVGDRTMYADLIKAQVKTMAFIAYVLRGPHSNIKEYLEVFPEACVRLLRDCPPEDVGTRKELLIATRHILTVDSRSSFVPYIDTMLEERVLVGTGVTSRETLRPLAYSVVADLIHHVRNELPIAQLARIVYVFSCNLNDFTFTSSIQTMCAKLLNTIVDSIHNKGDAAESTRIMQSMFFSSLQKLIALTEAHDRLKVLAAHDKGKGKAKESVADAEGDVTMEENGDKESDEEVERLAVGWREIEQAMPVQSVAYATESLDSFCKGERLRFLCCCSPTSTDVSQRRVTCSKRFCIRSERCSPTPAKPRTLYHHPTARCSANSSSTACAASPSLRATGIHERQRKPSSCCHKSSCSMSHTSSPKFG
jgi:transformation/transcription domain-associated protein